MNKIFDAFSRAFDEKRKAGMSNSDAFDSAQRQFQENFNFSPYKDAESYVSTRSYHNKKKKKVR